MVCVSYLASASLWTVQRFPLANGGAEIRTVEQSIAADAPMAAAVLTALDVPTLLLANDIGTDRQGIEVVNWLERYQVASTIRRREAVATPYIVIVADEADTRTWFPYLPDVVRNLGDLDLAPLAEASFAYIDAYQLIEGSAIRAVRAAREADVPLLVNLGGSPLTSALITAMRDHPDLVLQTNVDDDSHASATEVATSLRMKTGAKWVVITAGAHGAVASSCDDTVSVPSFEVTVHHTHCAGAAFSGGLLFGLRADWSMVDTLTLACASGALRCERTHDQPMPTPAELREFIGSRPRLLDIPPQSVGRLT